MSYVYNHFSEFSLQLLNQYIPLIADNTSWGQWIREDENYDLEESEEVYVEPFAFIGTMTYKNCFGAIQENEDEIVYPLVVYQDMYDVIRVKSIQTFLSILSLSSADELKKECPFLINLFRACISNSRKYPRLSEDEELNEFYQDEMQEEKNINLNKQDNLLINSFISSVVSKTFSDLCLPDVDFFHSIADYNYEGKSNNGCFIFCKTFRHDASSIIFKEPMPLDLMDSKLVRKLLEMTDERNGLLLSYDSSSEHKWIAIGIGNVASDDFATVNFLGHSKWKMRIGSETLSYNGTEFRIKHKNAPNEQSIQEENNNSIIQRFFESTQKSSDEYNNFIKLYSVLKNQKHGTMLVVTNGAEAEADRFSQAKRGIRINPIDCNNIDSSRLLSMSSIDGAMLIDTKCVCYGLGVILDGYIDSKFIGNSGRGARYNSAKLYMHNIKNRIANTTVSDTWFKPKETLVIVISEDGYHDVFSTIEPDV
ncbi:hypothetical protein B0O40_0401 [Ruminococcaceae bacterium R-25]|nr:hypothetical protein B0O40_0401 [Ruminococcaceae bacterium R-25]SUQ11038.1 hypothetical protein SAMN06297423_0401 [Oscillospiraceae bacterium]